MAKMQTRSAVRTAGLQRRPKGYWKNMYIEKQGVHQGELEILQQETTEQTQPSMTRRAPKPCMGRTLDTLHPPSTPSLFKRDWLRSLVCEGCGLPATTNTTNCLHCNVVVHNWCKDVLSGPLSPPQARPKRPGRRISTMAPQQQQQQSKLVKSQNSRNMIMDWVCWECQEDMVLELQYYRRLKNQRAGANQEKRAAGKIIRFITWVADWNHAIKAEKRTIMIQSFIRMRVVFVRFRLWAEAQKRAMMVSVRGANGLAVGDPVSRKCNPYIILTVVETSQDDPQQQVETISHRLQTKKGGDTGHSATAAAAASASHTEKHHSDNSSSSDNHPAAHGHHHPQSHDVGGPSASVSKSTSSAARARKHATGSKEKAGAEKVFGFHWDEEFLLPGVSDSATIIFTVLHQAPTRVVCLGQALVEPKQFSKNEEHVRTIPLAKQQVVVPSGPQYRGEEARIVNAEWVKPGNLTFSIRKSSYCDAHCSEVNGPIVEEINTLALAESQAVRRRDELAPAAKRDLQKQANKTTRESHDGKRLEGPKKESKRQPPGATAGAYPTEPASITPATSPRVGVTGKVGTGGVHIKAGDLSTVWWACVWQGQLRIFRHIGDAHAKLTLPLERWSSTPLADEEEESGEAKTARRDLRLFSASHKRWIVLRCATRSDKQRWEEVIARNKMTLT